MTLAFYCAKIVTHTPTQTQHHLAHPLQLKQYKKKMTRRRFIFCNKGDKKTQSRMKMQIQQSFFNRHTKGKT